MASPLVSVIIPAYNSERYVGDCIESLFAQTHDGIEAILVDDGSSDSTLEILKRYSDRAHVISRQNGGVGEARNAGVDLATGDYIAFIDSDDLWHPDKLAKQIEFLEQNAEYGASFTHIQQFVSEELSEEDASGFVFARHAVPGRAATTLVMRKDLFGSVGRFTSDKVSEFIDWYMRAVDAGVKFKMHDEVLARRRIHKNNTGSGQKESRSNYAKAIKEALDRRRAASKAP